MDTDARLAITIATTTPRKVFGLLSIQYPFRLDGSHPSLRRPRMLIPDVGSGRTRERSTAIRRVIVRSVNASSIPPRVCNREQGRCPVGEQTNAPEFGADGVT